MLKNVLDTIFPSRLKQYAVAEREQTLNRLMERELMVLQRDLNESVQHLGSPWQLDAYGTTLDQAWKLGFPVQLESYLQMCTNADVAHDDSIRNQVLKFCRHLYDMHPHAKGMVNAVVTFVCGDKAWTVEPAPKVEDPETGKVKPIEESEVEQFKKNVLASQPEWVQGLFEEDSEPDDVEPVADLIAHVDPALDHKRSDRLGNLDVKYPEQAPIDQQLKRKAKKRWLQCIKRGVFHPQLSHSQFWTEAFMRSRRDGECFIWLGNAKDDGRLTPRFLEPEDIIPPLNCTTSSVKGSTYDPRTHGVEVDREDPATTIAYWWRRGDDPQITNPVRLPAERVMHIKFGVDTSLKRGLPMLFVCRQMLKHFDSWINQSLRHQKVQSMVALLRQWDQQPVDAVLGMVNDKAVQSRQVQTPTGNSITSRTIEIPPVIDAPKGMVMSAFTPNGNYSDSEVLCRRVLLACASGTGLSEAMVSADGSNANYSSTRITQMIPMQGFRMDQGGMTDNVEHLYGKWYDAEAAMGRLPLASDPAKRDCTVTPSRLPNFEGELTTPVVAQQLQAGVVSKRTAMEVCGYDADLEEERIAEEEKQFALPPALQTPLIDEEGEDDPDEQDDEGSEDEADEPFTPVNRVPLGKPPVIKGGPPVRTAAVAKVPLNGKAH